MNINRNNYEEYFILYMDNELAADQRAAVEAFAETHADLKLELDLLLQAKLVPEEMEFLNKEVLLKSEMPANKLEQTLLLYLDNELDSVQKKEVEKIISEHPSARQELEAFAKAKLEIETIAFPDKSVLYRSVETRRVIAFNWKRVAAAAVLLIGIVTAGSLFINDKTGNGPDSIANVTSTNVPASTNEKLSSSSSSQTEVSDVISQTTPDIADAGVRAKDVQSKAKFVNSKENSLIASIDEKNEVLTNNLATPTEENYYVHKISAQPINAADINLPSKKTLTSDPSITQKIDVTPTSLQPLYTSNTSSEENEDVRQKGRRGGLRGFVRKITRTFEKTTDFEATDGDDRLLVAGLAIKL